MFHKILVALDKSDLNQQVLETAISLAKTLNSQIMLIHVLTPLEATYPSPVFAIGGPYPTMRVEDVEFHWQQWRTTEEAGLDFLRAKCDIATAAGIPTEFTQALGDPGQAICTLAKSWGATLILIGRRGYRGLGELLIGSVSNYVVHNAPCSVLTIQGTVDLAKPVDDETTISAPLPG